MLHHLSDYQNCILPLVRSERFGIGADILWTFFQDRNVWRTIVLSRQLCFPSNLDIFCAMLNPLFQLYQSNTHGKLNKPGPAQVGALSKAQK